MYVPIYIVILHRNYIYRVHTIPTVMQTVNTDLTLRTAPIWIYMNLNSSYMYTFAVLLHSWFQSGFWTICRNRKFFPPFQVFQFILACSCNPLDSITENYNIKSQILYPIKLESKSTHLPNATWSGRGFPAAMPVPVATLMMRSAPSLVSPLWFPSTIRRSPSTTRRNDA